MDIGSGGIASSPGTGDDKSARRRSRRVSFADTTAVHVFDRDEDFETPPEEREPGSTSPSPSPRRSSVGREDEEDTEEDFHCPPVIFLPDADSSSPGSAAGSMASADDENFFGPVSASFIQTGRPSDSGMSEDDNHDITMDSRTFSLHFRNIAPPDDCTANSAASLMTPNTASEGPLKELSASNPARTSTNVQDTLTDMSLLSGNPRTYGYDQLSPTLSGMMKKIQGCQQTNSPKHDVGRKRTAEEECPEETAKTARSPRKSRKEIPCASQPSPMSEEKQNGAHDNGKSMDIDWNKVVCTIANATEQVLSASISKYNVKQLDMLSDKLDEMHMANKYKRLSTAVRNKDCCDDKQKRLEEARFLHDKLFYEKAKLQIHNMKLVKLQKKAQLYQDRIQECCFLKSQILGAAQMKDALLPAATSVSASDRQEELAIISEKRLELKNIQQKVEKLRSSLECFHKIKGDIGSPSVVRYAEEQLMMRNQHRIIHQQAGLCQLRDIVKRDNKCDVILNYHNLLFQRIILNISDTSSIFVINSVNGNQIGQAFPNLDASLAFNFVFKAEENQRVSDLRSLQKKTTETSLLLGNLIDVLEEIKLSKFELLNLTSAAFVLESQTCKLGLHLSLMSFKGGKKIAFIIDMTDLNCSVYPSDPSELPIKVCEAQTTLAKRSIDETMASIRSLQPGRTVILRLCRMVSRLIHRLE